MAQTHAVAALKRRREEVAREIRGLATSLSHLDAAIRLMEADYRPPSARHGAITRAIFAVLREADAPMTTEEVAGATGAEPGQVRDALKAQRRRGLVRGAQAAGGPMRWEVAG